MKRDTNKMTKDTQQGGYKQMNKVIDKLSDRDGIWVYT